MILQRLDYKTWILATAEVEIWGVTKKDCLTQFETWWKENKGKV